LQRTGRLGTYAVSLGQDAFSVRTASVIREEDVLLPSYRDNGAVIWRARRPAYRARYKPWPRRWHTWYPSSLTTACALITLGVLLSGAVEH
jgi:hypothetical protein